MYCIFTKKLYIDYTSRNIGTGKLFKIILTDLSGRRERRVDSSVSRWLSVSGFLPGRMGTTTFFAGGSK